MLLERTGVPGDGHKHQQQPITNEQHGGEDDLPGDTHKKHRDASDEIPNSNRLQRVGKNVKRGEFEIEQMALHCHAENEQDDRTPYNFRKKVALRLSLFDSARKRKWHGRADDEQEQWHNEVPSGETIPLRM